MIDHLDHAPQSIKLGTRIVLWTSVVKQVALNKTAHKYNLIYCSLSGVWRVVGLSGGLPHLGQDVAELLTLPLGTDVCAQATLQEFQGTLVF